MTTLNQNSNILAIDSTGLCKKFDGKLAVDNVSLKVKKGEIFGFLGPNGSGKTTTIRMLCGLLTPDSGRGSCLGYDIATQVDKIKSHTGYMTQNFSLYDELTVRENLTFMARLYEIENHEDVVKKTIIDLGLENRSNQLVCTLSGGWKQRLSLGAALLHNPQLLLLDEPTAGVDPRARREFWDHIHDLADNGITVLVSTHYMDEAERCHRLAYIFQGKILIQGTKEEVIELAGLTTWTVNGDDLMTIAKILKKLPGIEQVVAFGDSLHVSGKDAEAMQNSMSDSLLKNHECLKIDSSLEDVFISLGNEK